MTDQEKYVQGRACVYKLKQNEIVRIKQRSLGHAKGNHGPHFNTEIRVGVIKKLPLKGAEISH